MNTLPPNFNKWLSKDWRSQKTDNVFSAILTKIRNEILFMEKHHTCIMYIIVIKDTLILNDDKVH